MAGTGKYTTYAPPASEKNTLLEKMFPGAPTDGFAGKELEYRAEILNRATAIVDANGVGGLTPRDGIQKGDATMQLGTVNLDYLGAPDITTVTHDSANTPSGNSAGGPATPYFPDITSPGPGHTDGVDKVGDPEIEITDVKPTYVPGGPNTGTRNPATRARAIAAQLLGVDPARLGDSGANG